MSSLYVVLVALAVALSCVEALLLQGGMLRAEQDPDAVWDEDSQQYFLRLTCGHFTFVGPPPLNVTWTTPKGESLFSSGYDSGRFFLHLNTPIQGGNYSCSLPHDQLPPIFGGNGGGNSGGNGGNISASVSVDEMKSRLKLAQANQRKLQEVLQQVEMMHAQDMANVSQLCQGVQLQVQEQGQILEDLQSGNNGPEPDLSGPCRPGEYRELSESWRSKDEELDYGEDYQCDRDLIPGWYRFYLHGEDAVIPTSCVPDHHCETHAPVWVDLQGRSLPESGQEIDVRACANWDNDCCNWESPITVRNCGNFYVYHLDPASVCYLVYCTEPKN